MNSFPMFYPKTRLEGRCHLQHLPPPTRLVNIQSPTAPVLKLFWKAVLRKQLYFLYNSGPQAMSLMENSAPESTKGNVPEETPKSWVSFLLPLTLYPQDTPIFGTPVC